MSPLPQCASTSLFSPVLSQKLMRAQTAAAAVGRKGGSTTHLLCASQASGEVLYMPDLISPIRNNPFPVSLINRFKSHFSDKTYQYIGIKVNILYFDFPHPIISPIVRTTSQVTQPQVFLPIFHVSLPLESSDSSTIRISALFRNTPYIRLPAVYCSARNKNNHAIRARSIIIEKGY